MNQVAGGTQKAGTKVVGRNGKDVKTAVVPAVTEALGAVSSQLGDWLQQLLGKA